MENYKEASKKRLRIQTSKGLLSVEQLWDLSITELDKLAVLLQEAYNNSKGKSFIHKRTTKDKDIKLQFDIVVDILFSKQEDEDIIRQKRDDKEHNERILELISEKENEVLKGKTLKELKGMLKT